MRNELLILLPGIVLCSLIPLNNSTSTGVNSPESLKTSIGVLGEPNLPPLVKPVNDPRGRRVKRQCGLFGCSSSSCRGSSCSSGCRSGSCSSGGCSGRSCSSNYCSNPCGPGGRLCCDNPAPRPCVGCGLNSGRSMPVAIPLTAAAITNTQSSNTCCQCCMPTCLPACIQYGGCMCGRNNGYDYMDYYG